MPDVIVPAETVPAVVPSVVSMFEPDIVMLIQPCQPVLLLRLHLTEHLNLIYESNLPLQVN